MIYIEGLRKLTKQIQDARIGRDNDAIKKALKQYDTALEKYIPVLMAQARSLSLSSLFLSHLSLYSLSLFNLSL